MNGSSIVNDNILTEIHKVLMKIDRRLEFIEKNVKNSNSKKVDDKKQQLNG
jgi:hypothetical protein|tara:strand:- start:201 stop:353 length:153 start_codon:yes stop_codon:yes gene_type:complete